MVDPAPNAVPRASLANQDAASEKAWHRVWLGFALAATLLVYISVVRFEFVYDDIALIVNNPVVRSWKNVGWIFTHDMLAFLGPGGNYYRPLDMVWFTLGHSLFGVNPAGWHAANLVFHLLATAATYCLARKLTADRMSAALAALIFGLHPVHIEGVAWVTGVDNPLMAILTISSFLVYARSREEQRTPLLVVSVALYVAAMLLKESAVVLPGFLALYEWTRPEQQGQSAGRRFRNVTLAMAPFAVLLAVYLGLRRSILGVTLGSGAMTRDLWLTLPAVLATYVRHFVWPVGLSTIYDLAPVTHITWTNFGLPLVICLVAIAVLLFAAKTSRAGLLATAWFCLTLLPVLIALRSFGDLEFVRDRYLYVPSVGLCILVAMGIRRLSARGQEWLGMPRLQSAAALTVAVLLAVGTATQVVFWASGLLLFYRAVQIAPQNPIGHVWLAGALRARGEVERSLAEYQQAYRLAPQLWGTNFFLGAAYLTSGLPDKAVPYLQQAIRIRGDNVAQYFYLGQALEHSGRFAEATQVLRLGREKSVASHAGVPFDAAGFDTELRAIEGRPASPARSIMPNH